MVKKVSVKAHSRRFPKKGTKKGTKNVPMKVPRKIPRKTPNKTSRKVTKRVPSKTTRKVTKKPIKKVTKKPIKKELTFAGDTKEEREFNRMKWEKSEQLKRYMNIRRNPPKKGISNKQFKREIEIGYKDKVINELRFGRKLTPKEFDITSAHSAKVIKAGTDAEYEAKLATFIKKGKRR